MYALRIRGIYATALTNLLRKRGFKIVQPSRPIQERFGLEADQEPYDLDLEDLEDRQGVFVHGAGEGLEQLIGALQQELPDVIVRRFEQKLYSVYRGIVQTNGPQGTLIDLGGTVGLLPEEQLHPSEVVTVQVCELPGRGREPVLRRMIGIPGRYAVLISTGRIAVSKRIADRDERLRLSWLGAELAPRGWGIVWHTAAALRGRAALAEDIERLAKKAAKLKERAETLKPPALLLEGEEAAQFEFPGGSKHRLDELRSEVLPTISGHHRAKASGREEEIEGLERMVQRLSGSKERGLLAAASPLDSLKPGATLAIEHVKLDGRILRLGQATLGHLAPEERMIELEREIRTEGEYDGLGLPKEPGDRAVTELAEGRWWYRTRYYSPAGELKGEYYNINTPIEVYPDRVRYIDLEIDLVRIPGEEPRVIDEEKLEEAVQKGLITEGLAERAREVTRTLLSRRLPEAPDLG